MIGTHFDADLLLGPVSINENQTIEILDVWVPPVADDSVQFSVDAKVVDSHLLTRRFRGEVGGHALDYQLVGCSVGRSPSNQYRVNNVLGTFQFGRPLVKLSHLTCH